MQKQHPTKGWQQEGFTHRDDGYPKTGGNVNGKLYN